MASFLKVVARNFDVLAGPVVTLVYPLYASVQAIETKSHVDDQQWLTYWVLYSMITLFELTFAKLIEWIPFWSYAKLIANCWLVLPYFSGAAYVYEHVVRPMFVNPQTVNIWYVPWGKKDGINKREDILTAAEKFIQENGTEAFESLITNESDFFVWYTSHLLGQTQILVSFMFPVGIRVLRWTTIHTFPKSLEQLVSPTEYKLIKKHGPEPVAITCYMNGIIDTELAN